MLMERGEIKPFPSSCDCSSPIQQTVDIQASPYHLEITCLVFMRKGYAAFALYPNLGRLPSFKGSMEQ